MTATNMIDRSSLITDLKEHIVRVYLKTENGIKGNIRCSLRPDYLPASYSLTESSKLEQFHTDHPTLVAAWNMDGNGWFQFDMSTLEYVEIVDTV